MILKILRQLTGKRLYLAGPKPPSFEYELEVRPGRFSDDRIEVLLIYEDEELGRYDKSIADWDNDGGAIMCCCDDCHKGEADTLHHHLGWDTFLKPEARRAHYEEWHAAVERLFPEIVHMNDWIEANNKISALMNTPQE